MPKYHEHVFSLFQTLKPRHEIEGSGMALAMVAKMVKRLNEQIQIRSDAVRSRRTLIEFDWPCLTPTPKEI